MSGVSAKLVPKVLTVEQQDFPVAQELELAANDDKFIKTIVSGDKP